MIWNKNSLEGLKNYKNPQILQCLGNKLTSLKGMENCKNLKTLYYSGNILELELESKEKIRELMLTTRRRTTWRTLISALYA